MAASDDLRRSDAPVLVLQHLPDDGPAFLGQWLDEQNVPWVAPCAAAGDAYPDSVRGFRALAVLGGAWSANDDRPSLRQAEALIREADALGLSVLGHCLGAQLMARAFGGRVQTLRSPEIGWHPLRHCHSEAARTWLGEVRDAVVFQWHHDGFVDLPPGAELLASSPACAHQCFVLRQHLAMQFHIEVNPAKLEQWMGQAASEVAVLMQRHPDSVQGVEVMARGTTRHQAGSEALARRIYATWRTRWRV